MHRRNRLGFTLIELLVVIAIIGILVTIVTTIGSSAIRGGKARQTQDTIRVVDTAVATYLNDLGTSPPAFVTAFAPTISPAFDGDDFAAYPLADAVDLTGGSEVDKTKINSIGLFMRALDDVGLGETLASVDAQLLTRWDGDGDLVDESGTATTGEGQQPELRTLLDGWGRPLRFVHPAWDGLVTEEDNQGNPRAQGAWGTAVAPINDGSLSNGSGYWLEASRAPTGYDPARVADFPIRMIRRNFLTDADREMWNQTEPAIGDSDGGYTIGNVPYIYSAGPDGDPSTLEDNSYTTEPRRPVTQ
jgi:prepilin-type N-terminal cleavage/methylation domain-containing protein